MRRLLASIHDVTPAHAERLDRLVPLVEEHVGQGRYALLVVPNFGGHSRISGSPVFARRLRGWANSGSEVFLHGFTHQDDSRHRSIAARFKASHLTAGEGEFLGLSYREAKARLVDGRALIEDLIGRRVAGFIAPAWLYGSGARRAIADLGFSLAEDHFRVWRPESGEIVARGPVLTYASRTRLRLASSLLWSRAATTLLSRIPNMRFAVHPGDVRSPALLGEIGRALASFTRTHSPSAYSELLAA
jgi:predicted deacetylase